MVVWYLCDIVLFMKCWWCSGFQQQRHKQLCCFLSGLSGKSKRTMHSLTSVHDLSVFNTEPGSAVVLCSTERFVLGGGQWRQSLHCDEEVLPL